MTPSIYDMGTLAYTIVSDVMEGGLAKHGAHVWYEGETVRHHVDRGIRHACTGMGLRDGNMDPVGGEDAIAHMDRAIVRLLMARAKISASHA
jgi:hypothetical protein